MTLPLWPESDLSALLEEVRQETGVPGISVALRSYGLDTIAAVGTANLQTRSEMLPTSAFELSCLMKFFVSVLVVRMALEEKIDLSIAIDSYLPELRTWGPSKRITAGHLLSHTSGYRGSDITDIRVRTTSSWERFIEFVTRSEPLFHPGTVFNYDHTEHVLIGRILSRLFGLSGRPLVEQRVFSELCIPGGKAQSDKDFCDRYVANHVHSFKSNQFVVAELPPFCPFWDDSLPNCTMRPMDVAKAVGHVVFSPSSKFSAAELLSQLNRTCIDIPKGITAEGDNEALPIGFSKGCAIYEDQTFGHNGSALGQTCGVRVDPEGESIFVVAVNAWSPRARDAILSRLLNRLKERKKNNAATTRHEKFNHSTDHLADEEICGLYHGSFLSQVTISREGNKLRFDLGPEGNRRRSFTVLNSNAERPVVHGRGPLSVCFATSKHLSEPVLHLGMHAYRKYS